MAIGPLPPPPHGYRAHCPFAFLMSCPSACSLASSSPRPGFERFYCGVPRGLVLLVAIFFRRRSTTIITGGFVRSPTQEDDIQPHTQTARAVDYGAGSEGRRTLGRRTHQGRRTHLCPGDRRIYGARTESAECAVSDPTNAHPAVRRFGYPCGLRPNNTVYVGPPGARVTGEDEVRFTGR